MGAKKLKMARPTIIGLPKTPFDNDVKRRAIIAEETEIAIAQLKYVTVSLDSESSKGRISLGGNIIEFTLGELLGRGSFGRVYKLGGEQEGTVVKEVKWSKRMHDYDQWIELITAEAALNRVFGKLKVGPYVPRIGVGFSGDFKTAYFFSEQMSGDVHELIMMLMEERRVKEYTKEIEKQIRHHITVCVRLGVACTDLKPHNMLYKFEEDGSIRVVLADFDSFYCCSLANSIAREKLFGVTIHMPNGSSGTDSFEDARADILSDVVPETEMECPNNVKKYQEKIIRISLGMVGAFSFFFFKPEQKYARSIMNNTRNENTYVYDLFHIRWDHYTPSFERMKSVALSEGYR
tara:strand:+ start:1424 stop:2470 length:1047 start_codon:yes stop_codon:yes gene_type:complete